MDRFEEDLSWSLRHSLGADEGVDVSAARAAVAGKVVRRAQRRKMAVSSAGVAVVALVAVAGSVWRPADDSGRELAGGNVQVASVASQVSAVPTDGVAASKEVAPPPSEGSVPALAAADQPAGVGVESATSPGGVAERSAPTVESVAGGDVAAVNDQPALSVPLYELSQAGVVVLDSSPGSLLLSVPTVQGRVVVEVVSVPATMSSADESVGSVPVGVSVVLRSANGVDRSVADEAVALVATLFD